MHAGSRGSGHSGFSGVHSAWALCFFWDGKDNLATSLEKFPPSGLNLELVSSFSSLYL